MGFHYLRFEGGPYNNLTMAVEEPLPTIYRVPIMLNRTRFHEYLGAQSFPYKMGHAEYELQPEYDLETDEACGTLYKLVRAPDWYYQQQIGSAL